MLMLARGWDPQHKIKLCFGCWRFCRYGPDSKAIYGKLERDRTCHNKVDEWKKNWEILLWSKPWPMPNNRIRCPMCVLDNQPLLCTTKMFKSQAQAGPPIRKTQDQLYMHQERMTAKYDKKQALKAERDTTITSMHSARRGKAAVNAEWLAEKLAKNLVLKTENEIPHAEEAKDTKSQVAEEETVKPENQKPVQDHEAVTQHSPASCTSDWASKESA